MISLLIPFGSHDQARIKIFYWVQSRWARLFPDFELCIGLGDVKDFNRSAARNRAFERAHGDIIIVTDADTCCPPKNVTAAIDAVNAGAPWVIAHEKYYSLTQEYTNRLLEQKSSIDLSQIEPFEADWTMRGVSLAGVLVMRREAFEMAGGYNEDFRGWGFEDNEFAVRLDHKWGLHERVAGPMLHLWHPRGEADFSQPHIKYNEDLYQQTVRAA